VFEIMISDIIVLFPPVGSVVLVRSDLVVSVCLPLLLSSSFADVEDGSVGWFWNRLSAHQSREVISQPWSFLHSLRRTL
jgi:hypothetical protein